MVNINSELVPLSAIGIESNNNNRELSSQEDQLRESSLKVIADLDEQNQEAMRRGYDRLGHKIGEGEKAVFIFSQPAERDVPEAGSQRTHPERYYAFVTAGGMRVLFFNKSPVNDGFRTVPVDEKYQDGEYAFREALAYHAEKIDDEQGQKRPANPSLLSRSEYHGYMGFSTDARGVETLQLKGIHRWSSKEGNNFGIMQDFAPDIVIEAVTKSKESAGKLQVKPPKPVEQQLQLLKEVQAMVA